MLEKIFKLCREEFIDFINHLSDAVFVMEAGNDFRYAAVNKKGLEMAGRDMSIIGYRIEDVLPPMEADFLNQKYQEVLDKENKVRFEHRTQDNRIGESTLSPIYNQAGQVTHIISITRDITERKLAERKLQEYEQKYSSLVGHNPAAIYELDAEGHIISVNNTGTQLMGYEAEELLGQSIVDFLTPSERNKTMIHFKRAKEGLPQEYEVEITHMDGTSIACAVNNVPIYIDGKITGIYAIAKNITNEKNLLHSLKESEERYRRLVEDSPNPIFIHRNGFIEYANYTAVRLLRASDRSQLIGRSIYDISPVQYRNMIYERNQRLVNGDIQSIKQEEEEIITLDGRRIDVEVTAITTMFKGKPAIHSIVRDISERKQLEAALNHMAFHDALTGLPNRQLFRDRVRQTLQLAKRNQSQFAILYLDCDHFKPINDELGHDAGDEFLKELATKLQGVVRESDTVARIGGDEFNILLSDIKNEEEVNRVIERITEALQHPWIYEQKSYTITMSIGVAIYPLAGDDIDTIIKRADQALYRAKESGRNTYKWHHEE